MEEPPDDSRAPPSTSLGRRRLIGRLRTDISTSTDARARLTTPIDETLAALHELVQEGTVAISASSNYSAAQIEEADRVARERGLTHFVSAQNPVLARRARGGEEILAGCASVRHRMLPSPARKRAFFTGKYARGVAATEGRLAGARSPRSAGTGSSVCRRSPASARAVLSWRSAASPPCRPSPP